MTAVSKNINFDVLDDIADEYNNTYHRTVEIKPIKVTITNNLMKKNLNLR